MGFFEDRSKKMEEEIFRDITRNPQKIGFSIILKNKESFVYRFVDRKYFVANLDNLKWSLEKNINELSWEELKKIKNNITFINIEEEEKWLNTKQKSKYILIYKKIINFVTK